MNFRLRSGPEAKTPRAIMSRSILANHSSTCLSQEESVEVRHGCTIGYWEKNASTRAVLCAKMLSSIT